MFEQTRFMPSAASSTADSQATPPSLSSNYTTGSSSVLRTATASDRASAMSSSPVQPETPTDTFEFEESSEACSIEPEYWNAGPNEKEEDDHIEVSDKLPSQAELDKAGDMLIYDANGVARPFKSLYKGVEHEGSRQMVIFVRHFYCGACQHYLKALTETITPSVYFSLPTPTTISIIGCGRPDLIPKYTTRTTCPFRVYADPSRKLYKALGMRSTVRVGKRPEYMPMNVWKLAADSLLQMARESRHDTIGTRGFVGGPFTQIGGEFLFTEGEPIWCHRMRNVRDHTALMPFKKILEMEDEEEADSVLMAEATPMPVSPVTARGLKLVWDGNGLRDSRLVEGN